MEQAYLIINGEKITKKTTIKAYDKNGNWVGYFDFLFPSDNKHISRTEARKRSRAMKRRM